MADQHPIITPPPELAAQWVAEIYGDPAIPLHPIALQLVERAAQWGADAELEACCEWADETGWQGAGDGLRTARRPKPPSLKRVALLRLDTLNADLGLEGKGEDLSQIRRALEALPDD